MIFYCETDNIDEQYHHIQKDLNLKRQLQNTRGEVILECLKNLNSSIPLEDETSVKNPQLVIELLESLKEISDEVRNSKYMLEQLYVKLTLIFTDEKNIVLTDSLKVQLEDYNKLAQNLDEKLYNETIKYEDFILKYVKNYGSQPYSYMPVSTSTSEENKKTENEIISNVENSNIVNDNPVLLISEKEHKVFLPYEVSDLNKLLESNHKYQTINELINGEYVVSLSRYNNPVISRFKETYNFLNFAHNLDFAYI